MTRPPTIDDLVGGRRTPTESLDAALEVVAASNSALNAVVTLAPDLARSRLDRSIADSGPLVGVPITIKDSFATAGIRTTSGDPALASYVPDRSAVAVARLEDAGAVVIGKTNLPIHAGDWQTYNEVFGTTCNPFDAERTPGGSSGGAAAALAAGMTPIELGSDIGGSIRIPASWCGVFGLKPSHGVIPMQGHIPGPPGTLADPDLAVAGPMARTAHDLRLAFSVLAGPNQWDAVGWRLDLPPPRSADLRSLRCAVWLTDPDHPLDRSVREALDATLRRLDEAGAQLVEARPVPALEPLLDVYRSLLHPITAAGLPRSRFQHLAELAADPDADATRWTVRFARAGTISHRRWLGANERRARLRAQFARFFQNHDLLLTPVTPVPAIAHDHRPWDERAIQVNGEWWPYDDLLSWVGAATTCLLPAASVPAGLTNDGLPVGLQVIGPYLEDNTVLAAAELFEQEAGLAAPTPPD